MKPVNFKKEILNNNFKGTKKDWKNEIENPSIELIGRVQEKAVMEYKMVNAKIEELLKAMAETALYSDPEQLEDVRNGLINQFTRAYYSNLVELDVLDPDVEPGDIQMQKRLFRRVVQKYNFLGKCNQA